jgi:hypothetical protein
MITIKTYSDLAKVDPADPALPVLEELLLRLFAAYATPNRPYRPEDHGYIVLIEEDDVNHALDLPELKYRLEEIPWEGAAMHGEFFHAVYLTNNEFGISFLIPDAPWVRGKLRAALEELVS